MEITNKILITGSNGQLGRSIKKLEEKYPNTSFVYTDVAELDITNEQKVCSFVEQGNYSHIINCAAYTAVDKAEEEYELAKQLNAFGPTYLAKAAKENNTIFIHISTDYIFDGEAHRPYIESDITKPPSAYGKSKLLGEEMVKKENEQTIIIRTSWLYSEFGHNFLKTMLKFGHERNELKVVFDQIGTPTYANDLAEAILTIIHSDKKPSGNKIYHFSNEGVASWYDFAQEIMKASRLNCKISPILSKEYPLPAPRPFYSVLDKTKIKTDFDLDIPYWKDGMLRCISNIER